MNRFFRPIVATAFAGALLVGGVSSAFAAQSSQSTTLSLTVPITLSLSGLAATYSATSPAGVTVHLVAGPMTVTTNNGLGYNMIAKANTATFAGTGGNLSSIPVGNDSLVVVACPTGDTCPVAAPLSNLSPISLLNRTTSTNGDTFSVDNAIAIPGALPADTYSILVTFTAQSN
jgi:hypothetical protein